MGARIVRNGELWSVSGDMIFATASQLLMQKGSLFVGAGDLVIDLADVERTDSAGLALLLEWIACARRRGVSIQFKNIPDALLGIAELSNVRELLVQTAGG